MTKSSTTTRTKPVPWLIVVLGLLVLGAAAAVGWNWYQKRYPSWFEEVRLSDGRVITIHQKREYHENYGTAQSWVTIDLPELGGKQVWHSYLMPQRVDVVDGKVYVFGIPRGDRQLQYYRFPKYYMAAFIWQSGHFERIPFLAVPEKSRNEENVYPCVPSPLIGKLDLLKKSGSWCAPRGDKGQLAKELNLKAYAEVVDKMAAHYRWQNRSE